MPSKSVALSANWSSNPDMANSAYSLQGKVALVTGGSRGIGRAIARLLGARGATVLVHGNQSAAAAQAVCDEIQQAGSKAAALLTDLAGDDAAKQLWRAADEALAALGLPAQIDILVNNAGVIDRAPIEEISPESFDHMVRVNWRAPFFIIQQGLPRLRDGGRIINLSSMGTRAAYPAMAGYAPTKAALEALTRLLAQQLGARGITVNAVAPGLTATDMNPVDPNTEAGAAALATIALGRFGQPPDIAEVVAFLASDAGGWVTAQCIEASGGQRL